MLPPLLHGVRRQEVPVRTYLPKYTAPLMSQILGDKYQFSTNIWQRPNAHRAAHSITDTGPLHTSPFHSILRRCALHAGGPGGGWGLLLRFPSPAMTSKLTGTCDMGTSHAATIKVRARRMWKYSSGTWQHRLFLPRKGTQAIQFTMCPRTIQLICKQWLEMKTEPSQQQAFQTRRSVRATVG